MEVALLTLAPRRVVALWRCDSAVIAGERERLRDRGAAITLRLLDRSLIEYDDGRSLGSFEVDVNSPQGNYYFDVFPGRSYVVELGLRAADGRRSRLARSRTTETPRERSTSTRRLRRAEVIGSDRSRWGPRSWTAARIAVAEAVVDTGWGDGGQGEEEEDRARAVETGTERATREEAPSRLVLEAPSAAAHRSAAAVPVMMALPEAASAVTGGDDEENGNGAHAGIPEWGPPLRTAPLATAGRDALAQDMPGVAAATGQPSSLELAAPAPSDPSSLGLAPLLETTSSFGVTVPAEADVAFELHADLVVYGRTEPGATVSIDGRAVQANEDGTFEARFALGGGADVVRRSPARRPEGETE